MKEESREQEKDKQKRITELNSKKGQKDDKIKICKLQIRKKHFIIFKLCTNSNDFSFYFIYFY